MNFKGIILAVVSFLLVAVSCSVENDSIMNDLDNSNNNIESAGEKMACLSLNIGTEGAMTKSVSNGTPVAGDAVENYFLFIFEGDKIINQIEKTTGENAEFLTKVKQGLAVLVVANPGKVLKDELRNCSTYQDIVALTAKEADLKDGARFMVSERQNIEWGSIEGSTSTAKTKENTLSLSVKVYPRTALLSLNSFETTFVGGTTSQPTVTLKSVVFSNMKSSVNLNKEEGSETTVTSDNLTVGQVIVAYPNTTSDVKVKIDFTVTTGNVTREESREYVINDGSVEAGTQYLLNVTVKVGKNVDVNLVCTTQAWKDNSCDIPVEEVK